MLMSAKGFSLVELLVAMAAGLLLIAGFSSLFVALLTSQHKAMQQSRLNQEIQGLMEMISRDIAQSGYDGHALRRLAITPSINSPFAFAGEQDFGQPSSAEAGQFHCLKLRYDSNNNGELDEAEQIVYSYDKQTKAIKKAQGLVECGQGSRISTDNTIAIEVFNFQPLVLNGTGRQGVSLAMGAHLKALPSLTIALSHTVAFGNE